VGKQVLFEVKEV